MDELILSIAGAAALTTPMAVVEATMAFMEITVFAKVSITSPLAAMAVIRAVEPTTTAMAVSEFATAVTALADRLSASVALLD